MNETIIEHICIKLLNWRKQEFCCGWHWFDTNGNQVAPKSFNPCTNLRDSMIVFKSWDRATIDKIGEQYLVTTPGRGESIQCKADTLQGAIVGVARKQLGANN